jgi:uncharacterized FlgJ-related protein
LIKTRHAISSLLNLSGIPAAQRAVVQALLEEVAALKDITKRQEHLIAELNHALHGKWSEKLSEDERQLAFEDLSIALAEVEAEKGVRSAKASDGAPKPAPKRTIGNLPAALPCIEKIIEPASLICLGAAVASCTRSAKIARNGWTLCLPRCA